MVTLRRYQDSDVASQCLVPAIMDDIGITDKEVREETQKIACRLIVENPGIEIGDLQGSLTSFQEGYEIALRNHNLYTGE